MRMHVLRRLAVAVLLGVSACSGNNSNDNAPPTSFSIGGTVQGVQTLRSSLSSMGKRIYRSPATGRIHLSPSLPTQFIYGRAGIPTAISESHLRA